MTIKNKYQDDIPDYYKAIAGVIDCVMVDGDYLDWLDSTRSIGHSHIGGFLPLRASLLKPKRIIFNNRSTICIWEDDTKTIVRTSKGEKFVKEYGVAMCIVKKLYGSRNAFLREVATGYNQDKEEK